MGEYQQGTRSLNRYLGGTRMDWSEWEEERAERPSSLRDLRKKSILAHLSGLGDD
mgnify:CR=1 FL=1